MIDEPVVEVFTTQVSVAGGGLDHDDTLLDGEEGDVELSSPKIEDLVKILLMFEGRKHWA